MAKDYKDYTFEKFFNDKIAGEEDIDYKKKYENLKNSYHQIKEIMKNELVFTHSIFSLYSSHDASHSEKIIDTIQKLLEKHWNVISVADAWMFLCCAYIHDMGMCVSDKELQETMRTEEFRIFLKGLEHSSEGRVRTAARNISFDLKKEIICNEKNFFDWVSNIPREMMLVAAEYYRPQHAERVEKKLKDKDGITDSLKLILSLNGGIKSNIISMIAQICAMHGADFKYILKSLPLRDNILGITYHPRFIAILLRIGDLCDLDCDRFSKKWIEAAGGLTKTNLIHYYKHQSVIPSNISPEEIFIEVDIDFKQICNQISGEEEFEYKGLVEKELKITECYEQHDFCSKVVLETKNWFHWIKEELKNIKLSWKEISDNEIPLLEPKCNCYVKINKEDPIFEDKNIRFMFSNEKAYSLIEGYNLYDDQLIFVRELIQNSLDALKLKFWHDLKKGNYNYNIDEEIFENLQEDEEINYSELQPFDFKDASIYDNYKVIVKVEHKEGDAFAKFIIEDNGIGISTEDLKNKIINTGTSYQNEKSQIDMKNMPKWLYPTGSFGIGLHSVFALSDSIYIYTKPEEGNVCEITLHSGKNDGIVFVSKCEKKKKFCERYSTGTHIEVILDMNRYKDNIYEEEEESTIFEDRPESSLCFAIERKIEDLFISPLFEIQYNCGKEIKKCKKFSELPKYSLLFHKNKRNKLCDTFYKDKGKEHDFVLDRYGNDIIIWLRRGIIFYFSFDDKVEDVLICCKGIKIKNIKIKNSLPWIKIKQVDILSENSNKILVASRNELKKEWEDEIKKILGALNQKIAEVYYNLLLELEKKEEIKQWCCELEDTINLYIERKPKGGIYSEKEMIELARQYTNKEIEYSLENTIRYIIQKAIICIINKEVDKIKKFIKEDKQKKIKGLGKKVKEKIKKESYLIELITSLINTIRIELERELDRELERELGIELGIELGNEFGIEFGRELERELGNTFGIEFGIEFGRELGNEFGNMLGNEFGNEFGNMFGIEFGRELGNELGIEFGRELESELERTFGIKFGRELRRAFGSVFQINWGSKLKFEFRRICKKIFKEDSLNFIRSLPFYSVISLIATIKGYEYLCELQVVLENKILANSFGYNLGYYFINKKNVCDILTSSILEVYEKDFSYTKYKLPFIHYIPCNSLLIGQDNKIILNFDMKKLETRTIEIETLFLVKCYLNTYSDIIIISAFKGYEKISIKENNNKEIPCCTKNYRIVLWQKFEEIKKHSLSSQQEKQQLIDKLMNYEGEEGQRVKSVINYTYRNRAYLNKNETYEQTIQNIRKTYKQFISDILDCIMLSDEELKNIRFEDRENLL